MYTHMVNLGETLNMVIEHSGDSLFLLFLFDFIIF